MRIFTTLFLSFCLILSLSGCWSSTRVPEDMPKLCPATLTLTQDGKPLPDADVQIFPEEPGSRWAAGGRTDASGTVSFKTHGIYPGVAPGSYKVGVTKREMPEAEPSKAYDLVDPKYGDFSRTDLRWDVTPDVKTATFELGPPVRVVVPKTYP